MKIFKSHYQDNAGRRKAFAFYHNRLLNKQFNLTWNLASDESVQCGFKLETVSLGRGLDFRWLGVITQADRVTQLSPP